MTRKSRELRAQGKDVITLSIGEPDFDTPELIKEAGHDAITNNITHYPPVPGFASLQEAIVHKLKRDNNLDYKPNQIIISNGAKQSLANIMMSLLNSGDEVIIPAPYWVSYPDLVKLAEGTPVFIPTDIDHLYKVQPEQLEKAIGPKTKAIIFNSPNNPTGSIYTAEEIEKLAAVLKNHPDVFIISDEIYELINFAEKQVSFASYPEIKNQVIIVNGVSKGFAMTGWRIGYIAAPTEVAWACNKIQGQYTSGPGTISQMAAQKAIEINPGDIPELPSMVEAFRKRRDLVMEKLKEIEGVKTYTPEGAFYIFPDISYYFGKSFENYNIQSSTDMCMYLLEKANVALVPGEAFGEPNGIRISYATSEELLTEAVTRIKNALEKLN
ncbi:MAG: pyridoxal phosphate-dependent aminotransferase [Bacteroidales bacterium]